MTETSTAATISTPEDFKFGTVGRPFPGCQVKIADDGEVLIKGPNIFKGYYKNEEATEETVVDDWLHTGDIGELDSDGYLSITGRKKDIIITAGGKNITPANLEAEIKQHPLISQCVVIGDRRPYLVALVTLDPEAAAAYAADNGLPDDPVALASNPNVKASIMSLVDQINAKLRPRGAGQEDRDPPQRPVAGDGGADPDDEGQAERGGREVRREHRRALRVAAPAEPSTAGPVAGWTAPRSLTLGGCGPRPRHPRISVYEDGP